MFKVGQRQVTALIFILISIGAVLIGKTPENLLELIYGLVAPIGTVVGVFYYLIQAIQKRVNDPEDPFEPGDILDLFKSSEFVTAIVLAIMGLLPMIGIEIADANKEIIVNVVLGLVSLLIGVPLQRSFVTRRNRYLPPEVSQRAA